MSEEIAVELLDKSGGRALQAWTVACAPIITIGRADDRSVVVADPYVSRNHVEIERRADGWWLTSRGRHGVLVGGVTVESSPIKLGQPFQLGPHGPTLRLRDPASRGESATISFDAISLPPLVIDEDKLREDTDAVIASDYFQKLQRAAKAFRTDNSRV